MGNADHLLPAADRAHNGAAAFEEAGIDWRSQVDRDTLSMDNTCLCVVGQMYGRFHVGRRALHENHPEIFPDEYDHRGWVALGLVSLTDSDEFETSTQQNDRMMADYKLLDAAWKALI